MKVRYLISLLIIILVTGCTSIKSSHEISLDKIEGRKTLIVNYDRSEIQSVEINRIFLDSGVPYYVEPGEYRLKYIENSNGKRNYGFFLLGEEKGIVTAKVEEVI